ncbi:MAG: DUF5663 domain-containing protein [Minisyncoccia bacterium]
MVIKRSKINKKMSLNKQEIENLLKIDLFQELGLNSLDDDTKQALLDDMMFVIVRGSWIKLMERLNEEQQNILSDMLEKTPEDIDAIIEFLQKNIPEYEDVIKEEIANYKSLLLAKAKQS